MNPKELVGIIGNMHQKMTNQEWADFIDDTIIELKILQEDAHNRLEPE